MRTSQQLKELLIEIKSNEFKVPEVTDIEGLTNDMLKHMGCTDPVLRDELICSAFYVWADNGVFTTDIMKKVLETCISENYLFLGIGEKDTDTVFTRAFSSLYIGLALCMHDEEPYLTTDEVLHVKQLLLKYVNQEKDFRGYVEGKGWAHAIAHVSDALNDLVFCDNLTREDFLEVLAAIKLIALNDRLVYEAGEDDRVSVVFESICEREVLSNDEILKWLQEFDYVYDRTAGEYPYVFYSHVNRRHFLRCIYFMLLQLDGFGEMAAYVADMLKRNEGDDDDDDSEE